MTDKEIELGYTEERETVYQAIGTYSDAPWDYEKFKKMDKPGIVNLVGDDYLEEAFGTFATKDEAYDAIDFDHFENEYVKLDIDGEKLLHASEFWVLRGTAWVKRDETGEIVDIDERSWDWDGDEFECDANQKMAWNEYKKYELDDDNEDE